MTGWMGHRPSAVVVVVVGGEGDGMVCRSFANGNNYVLFVESMREEYTELGVDSLGRGGGHPVLLVARFSIHGSNGVHC